MLKKSVLLGSSLALALAVSGAAWAGDKSYGNKDDGHDWDNWNQKVYCPAKSEKKCERKGGDFDYKWIYGHKIPTCSFEQKSFVQCQYKWTKYKAKIVDTTTYYWLQYRDQCPSRETTEIAKCWKLGRDWKWYPTKPDDCKPCLNDEEDDGHGDNDHGDNDHGGYDHGGYDKH